MKEKPKKLYRYIDEQHRVFAGVLAGFAEYFNVDVVMVRVIFTLFVLVTGFFPGILAYIVFIYIMPAKPYSDQVIHDMS